MIKINNLWKSNHENDWLVAIGNYWSFVRPENIELERELSDLKLEKIVGLDPIGWYDFLHDKYFRWKYTAPNRYATTTMALRRYKDSNQLDHLFDIKIRLLTANVSDISIGISIAKEINGLGVAGASGLLSLMYPNLYGTVDQFLVKALCQVTELSESNELNKMKPESLSLKDGVILTTILRRKATENNKAFSTDYWTPRKIDMILWALR